MAVAGSGQFHHLRDPHEIEAAFAGELSDLFNIAAKNVRVELELSSIRKAELISLYWVDPSMDGQRFVVDVGDLIAGEERRLVVRLHIPKAAEGTKIAVRARILMDADGSSYTSPWKTMDFEAASENACDEEKRNMQVMHWVGLHYAEKAKKEALDSNRRGDLAAALYRLETAIAKISVYAEGDGDLMKAIADLRGMHADLKEGALDAEAVHEASYTTQRISRGQRDHRNFESH
jgi:hypothetical protein